MNQRKLSAIIKTRKHHNNKGYRQIKNGQSNEKLKQLADNLNIPYKSINGKD